MADKKAVTALVTGATGFIGKNLCKVLIAKGWRVEIIVREPKNSAMSKMDNSLIGINEFNGTTEELCRIVSEVKPDVTFHLASCFVVEHTPAKISELIRSNVEFGTQLLEGLRLSGSRTIITAGTSWQNYNSATYDPVNLYASTKQAFEQVMLYYVNACGFKSMVLKLFDTYGIGDTRPKIMNLLLQAMKNSTLLEMSGCEQKVDMVHVEDVAHAFETAGEIILRQKKPGFKTYAVSSGQPVILRDIVQLFGTVGKKKMDIIFGKRPYRSREVMVPWNKGKNLPSWTPKISLENGIKQYIDESLKNG